MTLAQCELSPEDAEHMAALARKYGLKSMYLDSKLLYNPNKGQCPECGSQMVSECGCATCHTCGFSLCH